MSYNWEEGEDFNGCKRKETYEIKPILLRIGGEVLRQTPTRHTEGAPSLTEQQGTVLPFPFSVRLRGIPEDV